MYYIYVLYSIKFERYYVGMTNKVERRIIEHNNFKVQSTKAYVPWEVVYVEEYSTRQEARKREKYLKTSAGRRWRKHNIRPRGATE